MNQRFVWRLEELAWRVRVGLCLELPAHLDCFGFDVGEIERFTVLVNRARARWMRLGSTWAEVPTRSIYIEANGAPFALLALPGSEVSACIAWPAMLEADLYLAMQYPHMWRRP